MAVVESAPLLSPTADTPRLRAFLRACSHVLGDDEGHRIQRTLMPPNPDLCEGALAWLRFLPLGQREDLIGSMKHLHADLEGGQPLCLERVAKTTFPVRPTPSLLQEWNSLPGAAVNRPAQFLAITVLASSPRIRPAFGQFLLEEPVHILTAGDLLERYAPSGSLGSERRDLRCIAFLFRYSANVFTEAASPGLFKAAERLDSLINTLADLDGKVSVSESRGAVLASGLVSALRQTEQVLEPPEGSQYASRQWLRTIAMNLAHAFADGGWESFNPETKILRTWLPDLDTAGLATMAVLRDALDRIRGRDCWIEADPSWRTEDVNGILRKIIDKRAFECVTDLADALEDADCAHPAFLGTLRGPGPFFDGHWVFDALRGRRT